MGLIAAWMVHLYTASSAVAGVWALVATGNGEFRLAMYLMMLTMVIDSTDGALARAVNVRGRIPWFDGRRLDDICDFFTYVLLPAYFMIAADLLPHGAWAAVPIIASAYGFSQDDAKSDDHYFIGFPSYWNVLAMYLYVMEVRPMVGLVFVLVLSATVFVPLRYIYPSRTRVWRPLSVAVIGVWTVGFSWLAVVPDPNPDWVLLSLAAPIYYVGLSLLLNVPGIRAALEPQR